MSVLVMVTAIAVILRIARTQPIRPTVTPRLLTMVIRLTDIRWSADSTAATGMFTGVTAVMKVAGMAIAAKVTGGK